MVTTLRLIQILVVLLMIPMVAIGSMAMFSGGGGQSPVAQALSEQLIMRSVYVPILSLIASEIVYRLMKHTRLPDVFVIPVVIIAIPLVMWAWMIWQLRNVS